MEPLNNLLVSYRTLARAAARFLAAFKPSQPEAAVNNRKHSHSRATKPYAVARPLT